MKLLYLRSLVCLGLVFSSLTTVYFIMVSNMYYKLGDTDHLSTFNPMGATSVIHFMQAKIYSKDLDGCDIVLKYPSLPLFNFKTHSELGKWVESIFKESTQIYVNENIDEERKIAYINATPDYRKLYVVLWLFLSIYFLYNSWKIIFRFYVNFYPREYLSLNDNNLE